MFRAIGPAAPAVAIADVASLQPDATSVRNVGPLYGVSNRGAAASIRGVATARTLPLNLAGGLLPARRPLRSRGLPPRSPPKDLLVMTADTTPTFGRAACGFLASTFLTSFVMVIVSAL